MPAPVRPKADAEPPSRICLPSVVPTPSDVPQIADDVGQVVGRVANRGRVPREVHTRRINLGRDPAVEAKLREGAAHQAPELGMILAWWLNRPARCLVRRPVGRPVVRRGQLVQRRGQHFKARAISGLIAGDQAQDDPDCLDHGSAGSRGSGLSGKSAGKSLALCWMRSTCRVSGS